MSSALPPRGWPGQFIPPVRANSHTATGRHSPVGSQRGNRIGNDFSDEPRVVFIDFGLGTIAARRLVPFFHGGYNG
ncbi:hypothetical protein [Sphingopyxis sp. 113P3]|uniref:hypothetical protein n=1 Tax=Sphingopyxis sp. (strain 113P3) TaxID=292913 RepID=UPI0006AD0DF0|nr:hypothetical protein [Sphingopyxis sp. 113P3]ALC11246.1 hypothetical protein LH20_04695 [Sphingopyxis sp. 113P3]